MHFNPAAWAWPQWTIMSMAVLSLIVRASQHGKPRTGEHSGFLAIIGFAIGVFVLTCGGFYGGHQ